MNSLEEMFGLRGKIALVTGASSGLGVEFADALAVAGADVALAARRTERLEETAAKIRARQRRAFVARADLSDLEDAERLPHKITEEFGPIDILVNNAGIAPTGRIERHQTEKWELTLKTNLTAAFILSRETGKLMIERGAGGRIIHVASVVGFGANHIFRSVSYCVSKSGIVSLTRQMAVEWARYGINVNAIAPGWFATEMLIPGLEYTKEAKSRIEQFTPLGRLGELHEVRAAVVYLASPAASFVTGSVLFVDGGWTAW